MSPQFEEVFKDVHVAKKVISVDECRYLIAKVGNAWDTQEEPVDKKPLWQTYEYGPHKAPAFLYGFATHLSKSLLIPAIANLYQFDEAKLKAATFWPFMRKYFVGGREGFKLHPDPTYFTALALLTEKTQFSGGNFMMRDRFYKKKKVVDLDLGDCVVFRGPHKHGVLPITSGIRHSLNMFYWNPKEEN